MPDSQVGLPSIAETEAAPEIVRTVVLQPHDDGRKGYYGPAVELLLMDDGTVQWRYDDD